MPVIEVWSISLDVYSIFKYCIQLFMRVVLQVCLWVLGKDWCSRPLGLRLNCIVKRGDLRQRKCFPEISIWCGEVMRKVVVARLVRCRQEPNRLTRCGRIRSLRRYPSATTISSRPSKLSIPVNVNQSP